MPNKLTKVVKYKKKIKKTTRMISKNVDKEEK